MARRREAGEEGRGKEVDRVGVNKGCKGGRNHCIGKGWHGHRNPGRKSPNRGRTAGSGVRGAPGRRMNLPAAWTKARKPLGTCPPSPLSSLSNHCREIRSLPYLRFLRNLEMGPCRKPGPNNAYLEPPPTISPWVVPLKGKGWHKGFIVSEWRIGGHAW